MIIDIGNFILPFQLNNYVSATYVTCKQINNNTLEGIEKYNNITDYQ